MSPKKKINHSIHTKDLPFKLLPYCKKYKNIISCSPTNSKNSISILRKAYPDFKSNYQKLFKKFYQRRRGTDFFSYKQTNSKHRNRSHERAKKASNPKYTLFKEKKKRAKSGCTRKKSKRRKRMPSPVIYRKKRLTLHQRINQKLNRLVLNVVKKGKKGKRKEGKKQRVEDFRSYTPQPKK